MKCKTVSEILILFMWCTLIVVPIIVHPLNNYNTWDWEKIDTDCVSFPATFLWGVSTSEYQNSGAQTCQHSNWAAWEKDGNIASEFHKSGSACDFWYRYPEDIALAKQLGLNAMRFSIDWSLFEPIEGIWDESVIQHYHDVIDVMIGQGITPMITLYHFSHPQWFEKKGAFEKESNIPYFVRYCQKVFDAFNSKISLWCTINEPSVYTFQGYIRGVFPPGRCDVVLSGLVLKNILKAHCDVYTKFKASPGGDSVHIGIAHQHLLFEPFNQDSLLEHGITAYLSHIATTAVFDFFATGKFAFYAIPLINNFLGNISLPRELWSIVEYCDPDAPKKLDFIGLNYYTRVLFSIRHPNEPAYLPGDIKTDMPYAIYPEGLYSAIAQMSKLGVPIYITENGIADATDDRRHIFIKRSLYALSQALKDGYDVRGYFYWTLMDNFEWDEGYSMKFGLYKMDKGTKERVCRDGSLALKNIIQKSRAITA